MSLRLPWFVEMSPGSVEMRVDSTYHLSRVHITYYGWKVSTFPGNNCILEGSNCMKCIAKKPKTSQWRWETGFTWLERCGKNTFYDQRPLIKQNTWIHPIPWLAHSWNHPDLGCNWKCTEKSEAGVRAPATTRPANPIRPVSRDRRGTNHVLCMQGTEAEVSYANETI